MIKIKKSKIMAFEQEFSQITFVHMITDQSISCCYEYEVRCLLTMVRWFPKENNEERVDHVHFSGWKYASLQETKECKNKAFNWKKKIKKKHFTKNLSCSILETTTVSIKS